MTALHTLAIAAAQQPVAIASAPSDHAHWYAQFLRLLKSGDYREAETLCAQIRHAHSNRADHFLILYCLAQALLLQGGEKVIEAEKVSFIIQAQVPKNNPIHLLTLKVMRDARAMTIGQQLGRAQALLKHKHYQEAMEICSQVLAQDNILPQARNDASAILSQCTPENKLSGNRSHSA